MRAPVRFSSLAALVLLVGSGCSILGDFGSYGDRVDDSLGGAGGDGDGDTGGFGSGDGDGDTGGAGDGDGDTGGAGDGDGDTGGAGDGDGDTGGTGDGDGDTGGTGGNGSGGTGSGGTGTGGVSGTGCDPSIPIGSPVSGTLNTSFARGPVNTGAKQYYVQNNLWNWTGGTFSMSYSGDSFEITANTGSVAPTGPPLGFPSLFIGSSGGDGLATAGSGLEVQLPALTSIPTGWDWSPPAAGTYAVQYDIWLSPTSDDDPLTRTYVRVWLGKNGGVLPLGTKLTNRTVEGRSWEYFEGTVSAQPVFTYAAPSTISVISFDLAAILEDLVTSGEISSNLYVTNIFAGFEIWNGSVGLGTDGFCIEVE